jgi:membrane-associated protease RseP (regulator of RpoE activity)
VGRGHWLIGLAALWAGVAHAGGACEEGRSATGFRLALRAGVLAVDAIDPGSPAARAGLRAGDSILQVNDVVPRACAQFARALTAARDDHKALLLLVRRGDAEVPLALGAATWGAPPPAEPGAETATGPSSVLAPATPPPPPPPPPLPPDTVLSTEGVLRDIGALAPPDQPPTSLPAYRDAVTQARREVETLGVRKSVPEDVVTEMRSVLRYYEGAVLAWDAIEGNREREHLSRKLPVPDSLSVPYFTDSPVASLIDEFTFLDATVGRRPSGGRLVEASGLWRPVWARLLLWERGGQALDQLRNRVTH